MNETRLPGAMGLVLRVLGFRTRLMVNPFFKRLFLGDLAEYQRWALAELERDAPELLVPAHGAIVRGPETTDALRRAIQAG